MRTKYCNQCERDLPLHNFTTNKARKDGKQSYCKPCMKLFRSAYYRKNKQKFITRQKTVVNKLKQFIVDLKNSSSCKDCGTTYPNEPWLLEFDHISPHTKINTIWRLACLGYEKQLKEEIQKCEIVCVLCHRRRTAKINKYKTLFI